MNLPLGHAQWFVDRERHFPVEWSSLGSQPTMTALVATALVGVGVVAAARWVPTARLVPAPRLRGLADSVPAILGATVGLGLIGLTALGYAWTPTVRAAEVNGAVVAAQTVIGAWLVIGVARAGAAIALLALTEVVAIAVDPLAVVAAAYIPAAAIAMLMFAKRGTAGAARSLRIGMGLALIAAATIEKLARPAMMILVVRAHPQLNVLADAGLTSGPETFTLLTGCVEVLLGALLLTGVASHLVALATLGPLVATVPLFGATELVGHLPIYGVLLVIAALAAPTPAPRPVVLA